jgi:hypothetical protein
VEWDATTIGAIFTGLSALLVGWTAHRSQRQTMSRTELREGRTERKRLARQVEALRRWGLQCEVLLIEKRIKPLPKRPPEYEVDWGLDTEDDEVPKRSLRLVGKR